MCVQGEDGCEEQSDADCLSAMAFYQAQAQAGAGGDKHCLLREAK